MYEKIKNAYTKFEKKIRQRKKINTEDIAVRAAFTVRTLRIART